MSLIIPAEVLEAAQMSETELRREIAVTLFAKERLTLAQASRMAEMNRLDFQHLLRQQRISRLDLLPRVFPNIIALPAVTREFGRRPGWLDVVAEVHPPRS